MSDRQQFRQAIVQALRQGLVSFDLVRLRETHPVSDDVARRAAKDVFFSQCLKATTDWTITDAEHEVLRQLGERLELSPPQQSECLLASKNRVFETELQEALDDEMISPVEANSLAHLRTTLGLAPMSSEEFGPPLKRPARRRENLLHKAPDELRPQSRSSLVGPWGPRSAVFGIPYTILILSFAGCLLVGGWIAFQKQDWRPVPLALGCAVAIILLQFLQAHCWSCGANWSLTRVGSDHDYDFFGGSTVYVFYECVECGDVKRMFRNRSRHRHWW